ncbi:MAG: mannitol dehydrogenase family protein [Solirubrobacterales bacterium]|nr:mannitol dehydrogenase family protein [Solirubrobacterales bacterium]
MRGVTTRVTTVSSEALPALAASAAVPGYDRRGVTVGVVHVGVGGFHRAHQALYLDRLMEKTGDLAWGICGVGLLPGDRAMKEALDAQDCLYTVVEKHGDGTQEVRVVGSLVEYLFSPDGPEAVIERMACEATRIVSLTITEGGYAMDPEDADIAHDVARDEAPRTTFGLITEALRRRRQRNVAPFTVMSCDNLPGNGHLTRDRLIAFARLRDPEVAEWIEREACFPTSMVDRITSVTTDDDRAQLGERHGIEDRWPVVCEPYTQWVLQDAFSAGRPALESVGVQVVEDVEPYELMKLRLLNASHQALGYLAYLSGYRLVHEAAQDPLFGGFLLGYMNEEATPTLPSVSGIDLEEYKQTLIERFSNPHVGDTVARLCAYGSDRLPTFLLPVVRHQLETGGEIRRSAAVVAAWARYAEGVDEDGEPIEVVDALSDRLTESAARQRTDPDAFLEDRELFGDLVDEERFVAAFRAALTSLHEQGARVTIQSFAETTQ